MSWIWKEENWPNWGLFIVTNTGKGFKTRKYEECKQGLKTQGKGFWKYDF